MIERNNSRIEGQVVIRGRELRRLAVWEENTWQIIHCLLIHLFSVCLELWKKIFAFNNFASVIQSLAFFYCWTFVFSDSPSQWTNIYCTVHPIREVTVREDKGTVWWIFVYFVSSSTKLVTQDNEKPWLRFSCWLSFIDIIQRKVKHL